jgi:hypothetical protein
MDQKKYVALVSLSLLAAGCGGSSTPETTTPEHTTRPRHERDEEAASEGVAVTGLMGTISQDAVRNALEPHMTAFARCFSNRMGDVEFLSGDITMSFRVDTSGNVLWVYPSASTIGDRETETCVLDVARRSHFAAPHGGEAEFTWGFGLDAAEDVRLPTSWPETHVAEVVTANRGALTSCGRTSGFSITAYVAPGGTVMAAGGTAPDADALPALDCVVTAVRGWTMPDPGSYAAKVSFSI